MQLTPKTREACPELEVVFVRVGLAGSVWLVKVIELVFGVVRLLRRVG
jgi:hypothetical protein